jgi:cystathionine beta-lyase/cystathionine gamma-synthase
MHVYDTTLRLSLGIEEVEDLKDDILQAIQGIGHRHSA